MMAIKAFFTVIFLSGFLISCLPTLPPPQAANTPTPATSPATTVPVPPVATLTASLSPTTAPGPARSDEEIFIRQPGPGSRVTSPILIEGMADPTFEQNLVVRVLQDDGTELVLTATTIQAETGQRGAYRIEVPIPLTEERNLFIQVFTESPRDGGRQHLASTGVIFTPTGPANIVTRDPQPEQIGIARPASGEQIQGGTVAVEGFGLASFEQTLLVEVQDENGSVVGSQPVMVQSAEMGVPGPFNVNVAYQVAAAGPGRIVVRDISPATGDDSHLSSVEVSLAP